MKYAVGIGSDIMIDIPSFVNIGSGIQNLIRAIYRQQCNLITLLLYFSK
jgi:hypothetical protein